MSRSTTRRVAISVALLLALLCPVMVTAQAVPIVSDSATAFAPAVRLDPPSPVRFDPVLLISDSAWLSFKLYDTMDAVQGFEHTFALASCRRRVAVSCRNYNGFVPETMYDALDRHPDGYGTLIVATGYNDSDGSFHSEVASIMTLARAHGYDRVVWLTLRSNVSYESPDDAGYGEVFERSNATLEQIAGSGAYPRLVVADWASFARDQHHWFADDGIHLRLAGSYAAGDYLSRKMAFLDERACPQPSRAGLLPQSPCPDPDVSGPVNDLASLYPLDQRGPDANFQLSWEGSGSWPAPPWWASSPT